MVAGASILLIRRDLTALVVGDRTPVGRSGERIPVRVFFGKFFAENSLLRASTSTKVVSERICSQNIDIFEIFFDIGEIYLHRLSKFPRVDIFIWDHIARRPI